MKIAPGQIGLAVIVTPPWPKCFKTCRHFDTHPEYPPDTFPCTKARRCTYHMKDTGTSGDEFWQETWANVVEMYCQKYERRCAV